MDPPIPFLELAKQPPEVPSERCVDVSSSKFGRDCWRGEVRSAGTKATGRRAMGGGACSTGYGGSGRRDQIAPQEQFPQRNCEHSGSVSFPRVDEQERLQ